MSKQRDRQTAEQFMAELERDPEYLRHRAEKDERSRIRDEKIDPILSTILLKLANVGFPTDSLQGLVKQYAPLPMTVVDMLLECLVECRDERVQESLVRALGAAKFSFKGQPLSSLFDSTSNENLRFAILNTIAIVRPISNNDWLEAIKRNDYYRQKLADLGYERTQSRRGKREQGAPVKARGEQ